MPTKNIECQLAQGQIGRYLSGERFSAQAIKQLEAHVADCDECSELVTRRRQALMSMLGDGATHAAVMTGATKTEATATPEKSEKSSVDRLMSALQEKAGAAETPATATPEAPTKTKALAQIFSAKLVLYGTGLAVVLLAMSYFSRGALKTFGPTADVAPIGTEHAARPTILKPAAPKPIVSKPIVPVATPTKPVVAEKPALQPTPTVTAAANPAPAALTPAPHILAKHHKAVKVAHRIRHKAVVNHDDDDQDDTPKRRPTRRVAAHRIARKAIARGPIARTRTARRVAAKAPITRRIVKAAPKWSVRLSTVARPATHRWTKAKAAVRPTHFATTTASTVRVYDPQGRAIQE